MGIFDHAVLSQAVVLADLENYININTLFGVVVVLAVLLLIALVYLANIMSYLRNNPDKSASQKSTVNNSAIQTTGHEHEELVGNNELVAVITAAIHEYMGSDVPANGFVVRSIRRAR